MRESDAFVAVRFDENFVQGKALAGTAYVDACTHSASGVDGETNRIPNRKSLFQTTGPFGGKQNQGTWGRKRLWIGRQRVGEKFPYCSVHFAAKFTPIWYGLPTYARLVSTPPPPLAQEGQRGTPDPRICVDRAPDGPFARFLRRIFVLKSRVRSHFPAFVPSSLPARGWKCLYDDRTSLTVTRAECMSCCST